MTLKIKSIAIGFICAAGWTAVAAQQRFDIEMTTRWVNNNTSLEINAEKRTTGSYTVLLQFTDRQNTRQQPIFKTVMRNPTQKLLTVEPIQADRPVRCTYRYYYIRGYRHPKLDSTFVYRLPYSPARKAVQAHSLYDLNERHFDGKPIRGWSAWQFLLEEGDTVFAMRKGIVVEVHDGETPLQAGLQSTFRSKNNSVLVEHPDGTLCNYSVLANGTIAVREGDVVFPGTPIAQAGAYYEEGERQVRICIYFPDDNPAFRPNASVRDVSAFEWVFYNPWFATGDGTMQLTGGRFYRATTSPELVQKEMTKKEIKLYPDL